MDFRIWIFCSSDQQGASADTLLQNNEQERRLHLDTDLRDCCVQFEKRWGAKHHLCQLCSQVRISIALPNITLYTIFNTIMFGGIAICNFVSQHYNNLIIISTTNCYVKFILPLNVCISLWWLVYTSLDSKYFYDEWNWYYYWWLLLNNLNIITYCLSLQDATKTQRPKNKILCRAWSRVTIGWWGWKCMTQACAAATTGIFALY